MSEAALPSADVALARTAARYRACNRFTRYYVASKLRRDPINTDLLQLASATPLGQVADLGCGRGQLAVALLEAGVASTVDGCDWAGPALAQAKRAATGLAFSVRVQDLATNQSVPPCDTALLIDVLYLLGRPAALALIHAAAAAARAQVIIRTLDPSAGLRGKLAVAMERIGRPVWPHAGAVVDPIAPWVVCSVLEAAGYRVEIQPCWRGTPFANVLLVGRRTPSPP